MYKIYVGTKQPAMLNSILKADATTGLPKKAYAMYRADTGKAEPIDGIDWVAHGMPDFVYPVIGVNQKQVEPKVRVTDAEGVVSFEVRDKTQEELDAELLAERQGMRLSKLEFRMGLNALGVQKRKDIEDAVALLDQDAKDAWIFADYFERNHPLISQLASVVGFNDIQLDTFFRNNVGISAS